MPGQLSMLWFCWWRTIFRPPDFLVGVSMEIDLQHVVNLARINLSPEEEARIRPQMKEILKYIDKGKLDLDVWSNALELNKSLTQLLNEHKEFMDHMKHHH